MTRSKSLTVAAILQALLSALVAISAVPILGAGSSGRPPFILGVVFLILAVAGLFGAYGLWINQKWGRLVTVITSAIFGLFAIGDVLFAALQGAFDQAAVFSLGVLACIVVVYLVLRREPRPALAA